jgi:hypothetical protein
MAAQKVLRVVIFGFLAKVTNGARVAPGKLEQDEARRNAFSWGCAGCPERKRRIPFCGIRLF